MPFSLKHIPYWNALEIKTNGRNSSKVYAEYMNFMDNIPEKQQPDEYTYLIPEGHLDRWMNQFGWTTTMTQTVQSIKGQEKTIMPDITYKPKHLDSLKLKPYPFQQLGISFLVGEKRGILGDEMGLGKAQPLDSKILTPSGWTTMGEIEVGSEVIGSDGKPHKVLAVYPQGEKDIYKLTFSDGSTAESCDEHLWAINTTTRNYRGNPYMIKELKEFKDDLKLQSGNNKYFIPLTKPVEFEEKDLPIDPYLLGYLIGNGALTGQSTMSVTIPNEEEVDLIDGLLPKHVELSKKTDIDYRIIMKKEDKKWVKNSFTQDLKGLGLAGKYSYQMFIPNEYKFSSVNQREQLLQGLLDSDGHIRPKDNNIEFSTSSRFLADDFSMLVQSLGGTAKVRERETTHRLAYRMSVILPRVINPFKMKRKSSVYKPREKYLPTRAITSIEYVGKKDAQCIYIDSEDHLYLTDNFVVTHNTPQALGALHELFSEGKIERALIIVPASLKFQWQDEVEKFTDYNAVVVDGTKKKRQSAYNLFKESENIQICIGGYESIRNDIDIVKDIDVDVIVADEAHRMGNRSTQTYKALSKLKSKYLFCLTGTPMQNRPNEIYALMQWVDKDVLGGVTKFRKKHVVIGEKFGRKWQELGYKNLDDLRQNIAPKLLRRMKSEVAPDLPEMVTSTVRVDMNTAQAKLYKEIQEDLELLQEELKEFYELQTEEDAREGKTSKDEDKILGYMYMMQAVSDHPYLLARGKSKMAQKYLPLVRKCKSSPKLEELVQVLTPLIERGSKIVIFSKYTSMLEIIYERISREFEQHPYVIHGGVPAEQRQEQVRDFTNLPMRQIMLLSDAGNYGLNLQTADTLINYELQWNPAVMAQRAGRIHRIGSTNKTVDIVNMITNDTIDETIANALERKTELTTGLIEKTAEEKDIMKDLLENLS